MRDLVFLVDDDEPTRSALADLLGGLGMSCLQFESAEKLLAHHSLARADCIVMDMCLPDAHGLELQKEFTRRGLRPNIVFMSGACCIHQKIEAMEGGAIDFLPKPLDETSVKKAVIRAIEISRGRGFPTGEFDKAV